jgi:hypothetical protein
VSVAEKVQRNPFELLGLPPTANAREIEREGQKKLALIAAGLADDSSEEASFEVRAALETLRDPRRRLAHEVLTRNLRAADIPAASLEPALSELEAALPSADDTALALAEEILWRHLEAPPPYRLPETHEVEKRRAFGEPPSGASPATLFSEMPWGELVRFRPREKKGR